MSIEDIIGERPISIPGLRAWLAGQALPALIRDPRYDAGDFDARGPYRFAEHVADDAVKIADAVIIALAKARP